MDIFKFWLLKPFDSAGQDPILLISQPWFRLEIPGVSRGQNKKRPHGTEMATQMLVASAESTFQTLLDDLPNKSFSFLVVLGTEPRVLSVLGVPLPLSHIPALLEWFVSG